ncbi:hypothetical protein H9L12_00970 [Sphingomonas rhizophila]|uniref:Uncharacterized protein n=1 Tax=Sphingomonas rhizophila TaxID=2071607 RepID=A0A7G9SBM8_9SPHN|nr:hypothetical protein [Sphingomonas rhizophila]QNN65253.1 hypothetical protein H9L12_00970 [Sphingomonas rhizophila]
MARNEIGLTLLQLEAILDPVRKIAEDAKQGQGVDVAFDEGHLFGIGSIVLLLKQRLKDFGIDPEETALAGLDEAWFSAISEKIGPLPLA